MDELVPSDRARRLHHQAVVVDLHADTPSACFLRDDYDFAARHDDGHVDLPRLRDAGVDLQFLIAWVPEEYAAVPGASFHHAMALLNATRRVVGGTPGTRLATGVADVDDARRAGAVTVMIGVEGGHAIENSLELLRELHAHGARYLTLTWNNSHDWADAAGGEERHGGLTPFGRAVVREMNRLGMLVDVSHAADSTLRDVLDAADGPVIASHSNARAVADHPRNLADDQLRAIASTGGVIGLNAFPAFLDTAFGRAQLRIDAEARARFARSGDRDAVDAWTRAELGRLPPIPLAAMADHADHIAAVAGIDHVALGCDFDGIPCAPAGLPDIGALPCLTELLLRRGWSDDDIGKLLGSNVLRVLASVAR